jgi:uncharacterized membrane protein required for colicin V production
VTTVDWIALGVVAVTALAGLRRGLIATALSLVGLLAGAYLGARIGPALLSRGARSQYTPVAALLGAVIGATLLGALASGLGFRASRSVDRVGVLRTLDRTGGLVAGAAWGLALVWVAGAIALELPGQVTLRQAVQRSGLFRRLNQIAPPRDLLNALARIDPLPVYVGPLPPTLPPDRRLLAEPAVRRASESVLRITALACGLGVEGTGWVAAPHLVVTAAHVVAGAVDITAAGQAASAWVVDRRDDIAVLEVPSLTARPLRLGAPRAGQAVAILGYPENGPFDARPGRIGATGKLLFNGQLRNVTILSGLVRHGNSGSPAVDGGGTVRTTVFASEIGAPAGFGVATSSVRNALARARHPVSTGTC